MTRYYRDSDRSLKVWYAQNIAAPDGWTPVVVIDPEDREAIERLCALYRNADDNQENPATLDQTGRRLQNALREMVKHEPPKCTAAISVHGTEFKRCEADQHDESRPHRCGGYTWTGGAS